jgi:hypothetical protein
LRRSWCAPTYLVIEIESLPHITRKNHSICYRLGTQQKAAAGEPTAAVQNNRIYYCLGALAESIGAGAGMGLGEAGALLELPPELPAPILGASPQADNSSKALVTATAPIRGNVSFANCWNLIVIDKPFWYCAQNRSGNI